MALDMTSFDAALKQHYTDDMVLNLVYKDNPLLALMPKYENFGGKNLPIAVAGTSTSQITDFVLTRVKDYAIATIDNETLEASKGNANAFMEAATTEIDGAINALTRSLAIGMYRTSAGELGQVSVEPTVAANTTITMKSAGDITNIEIGQVIVIWSALSGGSQRTSDGSVTDLTVDSVDRSAGTFTASGQAYDASGTIAADDYIFALGDRGLSISGLEDWVPASAPSGGDSHFGVDRSVDSNRLAGVRYDGSSDPIEEALIEGASRVAREGGKIDHCFLSYSKYAELEKALGSKVQYVDLKMNAEIGFRGILINGPRGPIKVVPDQNCPDDVAFMLQLSTWKLYSLGKAVRVIDTDGLAMLRQASSDGVEARYGFYGNVGCKGPGFNCRVGL
jgi:hypothetical protein